MSKLQVQDIMDAFDALFPYGDPPSTDHPDAFNVLGGNQRYPHPQSPTAKPAGPLSNPAGSAGEARRDANYEQDARVQEWLRTAISERLTRLARTESAFSNGGGWGLGSIQAAISCGANLAEKYERCGSVIMRDCGEQNV